MEVHKTMYGNNEDVPKSFLTICIQNHTYVMSHLQLCGTSLRQMKMGVSINHQLIELGLLFQCGSSAWNNMLASMQYQVRCMLSDFSYASNCQSHNLDRTTWSRRTMRLENTICLIHGVRITSDYGSSHVTGPWLVFSQCHISDHFLVLFYAPWASFISFSIPTLAAGAGTIPSRAGYLPSMLNILISPHIVPLELPR
jgi:hypothetical protein